MANMSIAVIGAGSWGTALSIVLANNGFAVDLLARTDKHKDEINYNHTNHKYLPEIKLPDTILAHADVKEALKGKKYIVLVVPSHAMRDTAKMVKPYISDQTVLIHATKGLDQGTYQRMSEVIHEELPGLPSDQILVLSGPSHAEEVSRLLPTTVVVAGRNISVAEEVQDLFINSNFRVYTNPDIIGVEIAGALKNIIALGAGLSDGLEFGDNAKAALLTRGLAEIARLGIELGANPLTFSGLAGVGDLVVTCTSQHSRNWRAGYMLGKGQNLDAILKQMGMVVEGVKTTKAAFYLSQKYQIQMPITNELFKVLFENKSPKIAVEDLMGRVRTHEMEEVALSEVFKRS
ncbi:NAD(P)H-dependent glycerol-3-phosphate dehydrogenase [Tepidibacillus decaturensis]|uniref:Glycerol-3-phosphate dehydrogenase [NAD(P)+] n=1 Tax=Tepidibacillus decaturensis TaxID=1413211 RepID=A0A135L3S9_9BACI|nr:NAD(P)H-dependent glycerol-3-phosphate dehydrogenase [Tepidibacillus decaturensis]KXG43645.1 glycerol-3-phosphate dehydrogenase [Tepidibacillus decaturensis]